MKTLLLAEESASAAATVVTVVPTVASSLMLTEKSLGVKTGALSFRSCGDDDDDIDDNDDNTDGGKNDCEGGGVCFDSDVCWLAGCLTSHQHVSETQGRIGPDNCTCCHTETYMADPTAYLTQS